MRIRKETTTQKQQQKKMTRNTTYLSILTLNINGLNPPIKRPRIVGWIKKQDPGDSKMAARGRKQKACFLK
jgi:hypothetical protein